MKMAMQETRSGQSLRKFAAAYGFNFKSFANYCKKFNPSVENATDPREVILAGLIKKRRQLIQLENYLLIKN